jgi:hypothetical protein
MDQRYLVRPCLFAPASAIDIGHSVNKSASTTDGFARAGVDRSAVQQGINNGRRFCFDVLIPQCRIFDWPYAVSSATMRLPFLHRRFARRAGLWLLSPARWGDLCDAMNRRVHGRRDRSWPGARGAIDMQHRPFARMAA